VWKHCSRYYSRLSNLLYPRIVNSFLAAIVSKISADIEIKKVPQGFLQTSTTNGLIKKTVQRRVTKHVTSELRLNATNVTCWQICLLKFRFLTLSEQEFDLSDNVSFYNPLTGSTEIISAKQNGKNLLLNKSSGSDAEKKSFSNFWTWDLGRNITETAKYSLSDDYQKLKVERTTNNLTARWLFERKNSP